MWLINELLMFINAAMSFLCTHALVFKTGDTNTPSYVLKMIIAFVVVWFAGIKWILRKRQALEALEERAPPVRLSILGC